jgi:transposase
MEAILGIDIAKAKFDVRLLRPDHEPEVAVFENTHQGFEQCHRFMKQPQAYPAQVCMEATGVYYEELAHFLHDKGYAVSVVNPLQIKAYAHSQLRRNKTDQLDAAVLADFCRRQTLPGMNCAAWYAIWRIWRRIGSDSATVAPRCRRPPTPVPPSSSSSSNRLTFSANKLRPPNSKFSGTLTSIPISNSSAICWIRSRASVN